MFVLELDDTKNVRGVLGRPSFVFWRVGGGHVNMVISKVMERGGVSEVIAIGMSMKI